MHGFTDFLRADAQGAFDFVEYFYQHGSPDKSFLDALRTALPQLDFAHKVAGLMIARDWDPDSFAAVAAPHLADPDASVWTAAHRLLRVVSSLDQATFHLVEQAARSCRGDCADLLASLRTRVRHADAEDSKHDPGMGPVS